MNSKQAHPQSIDVLCFGMGRNATWTSVPVDELPQGWHLVALEYAERGDGFVREWEGPTPLGWTRVTVSLDFDSDVEPIPDEVIEVEVCDNVDALGLAGKMRRPYEHEISIVRQSEAIANNEELSHE